jgi:hypothetical protein
VRGIVCHRVHVHFTKSVVPNVLSLGTKRSKKAVPSARLASLVCLVGIINLARETPRVGRKRLTLLVSHDAVCYTESGRQELSTSRLRDDAIGPNSPTKLSISSIL